MNVGFNFVVAAGRNSGAKEYLVNLLRELIALDGPELYTVYFAREEAQSVIDGVAASSDRVRCVRTPIPMFPTWVRVLRGERYWARQLERDGIDVFHQTYFPLPRGVEHVARVVLTLHDLIQRGMPSAYTAPRRWFTNLVQPAALRRAHRIVVGAEHVREDVARFHPEIDLAKVEVIPDAVSEPYLDQARRSRGSELSAELRRRYNLPERFILGVGHLEPRKNWPRLIRAYARVRRELGAAAPGLAIVGAENWKFRSVYDIAGAPELREHVSFTGYVDPEHMAEVYAAATAFVYPSLYEGFGIPVLEAMACGIPVLTSNSTSLPEISGGAACLVDPYDVESIASGLRRILTDPPYRADLVERGFANVSRFSWKESARQLRETYHDLAGIPAGIGGS